MLSNSSCHDSAASPWAALNLRRNPFGEPDREDLPLLIEADLDDLAHWIARPRHALQLIGHCGRGKSTRLFGLLQQRPDIPYLYLAEGEPIPPLPAGRSLFLDEAQRLPRWRRWRLFRRLDTLALATHGDHARELRAAGWTVRSIEIAGLDFATFERIVGRRLEWARLGEGPLPLLGPEQFRAVHRRFGDDLRGALDQLYEIYQRALAAPETTVVQMSASDPRSRATEHRPDLPGTNLTMSDDRPENPLWPAAT